MGVPGILALVRTLAFAFLATGALSPQKPAAVQGKVGAELDAFLDGCVPFGFAGSVLVVVKGQPVLRKGYGLADPEHAVANTTRTLFDIGSLTKQFSATAILLLESKGQLATSDSIAKHIEGVPADKQAITIHHLLTHTSGINGTLPGIGSLTTDRDEMIRRVFQAPLVARPGEHFQYSNTGYGVLAVIIERVAGQSFESFLKESLFKPAGMTHTGFCQETDVPRENASIGFENSERIGSAVEGWYSWGLRGAGGVLTSIDDMERWEAALAGRSFLPKDVSAKLYTPVLETYAYGWRVRKDDRGKRLAEHGGTTRGFEAKYLRHLDEDTSIVILSNSRELGPSIPVALDHIAHGEPHSTPPKTVRLEPSALASHAGKFALSSESGLEIRVKDDGLSISAYGQPAVDALLMQKPDPEQCALMTAAAGKFVEALKSAKADVAALLLKPGHMPSAAVLLQNWKWRAEKNGELKSVRPLGCTSSSESGACYVRLVFEHKEETLRMGWTGNKIDGVHYDDKFPFAKTFMPESSKSFVNFELFSLWARQRVVFEVLPDGEIAACSLKADRGDVRFPRAAK